jgi:hypothetical protein
MIQNISKAKLKNRIWIFFLAFMALIIIIAPTIKFLYIISEYFIHLVGIFLFIGLIGYFLNNSYILLLGFGLCTIICLQLKNESETVFKNQNLENAENISLALINLSDVKNTAYLTSLLQDKNPDVISFLEVTPDWVNFLFSTFGDRYPHHITKSSVDFYGKAIFSKYAILSDSSLSTDLSVDIKYTEDTIQLITTYIMPSLDKMSTQNAMLQFNKLSECLQKSTKPTLVYGQFNHVYWSPEIKNFKSLSGLKNCRNSSLPSGNEIQNQISFHNHYFQCYDIKDLRLNDGSKIGILSYYLKILNLKEKVLWPR